MRRIVIVLSLLSLFCGVALAQDPVKVDPKHYSVIFENDEVRVLRITYGPGEKSVMHDHPDGVVIYLTDHHVKFTFSDGNSEVVDGKAKGSAWIKGGKHLPENVGKEPLEAILVEQKNKTAKK